MASDNRSVNRNDSHGLVIAIVNPDGTTITGINTPDGVVPTGENKSHIRDTTKGLAWAVGKA